MVQLATRAKRKVVDLIKACPVDLNGISTKGDFNILLLGSYECLIGMDWLDQHHVVLDYHNKAFNFLNEEGNPRTIQGILREVTVREISTM
jgi:hypothetical protein